MEDTPSFPSPTPTTADCSDPKLNYCWAKKVRSAALNAAGSWAGHRWRAPGTTISLDPGMQRLAVSDIMRK